MEWVKFLITSICSLMGGGLLVFLVTIRSIKARESGVAKQEVEKGEEIAISNTEKIVALYKQALEDNQSLWNREKKQLITEIDSLKNLVESQNDLIYAQNEKLNKQDELIKSYLSNQSEMKTEIEILKTKIVNQK